MITLDYRYSDEMVIGHENGLNLNEEFTKYKDTIAHIIADLNKRKDKPGQWLQWMNLGYSEETVWYVKEYAAMVQGRYDNILVLGIGGSALGGIAITEALTGIYSRKNNVTVCREFFSLIILILILLLVF